MQFPTNARLVGWIEKVPGKENPQKERSSKANYTNTSGRVSAREATSDIFQIDKLMGIISHYGFAGCPHCVNMAADSGDMTFALPDLSGLSEAERLQVMAVMQRAKVGVSSRLSDLCLPVVLFSKAILG